MTNLSSKKTKQSPKERNQSAGKGIQLTTQNFRSKLWAALDWLFDEEIANYCSQVILLETCLASVSQPPTSTLLFSLQTSDIANRFWNRLEELLRTSFTNCAIHVSQHLKQDLPKLLISAHGIQAKYGQKFAFR